MALQTVRFFSVLFVALAFAPAMAHVLELPNKIHLSKEHYRIVQQSYRGWSRLAVIVVGALMFSFLLTVMVRKDPKQFTPALIAFCLIALTQVIFWAFTFPANKQTANWTTLPANWERLRAQWEYSHAASAILTLLAFVALVFSIITAIPVTA